MKIYLKNIIKNILSLGIVVFAIYFVFKDYYQEILGCLANLSPLNLLLILSLGFLPLCVDGLAYHYSLNHNDVDIKFSDGFKLASINVFFNVLTSYVATMPLQVLFLKNKSYPTVKAIKNIIEICLFHKLATLSLALLFGISHFKYLKVQYAAYTSIILLAFIISAVIVIALAFIIYSNSIRKQLIKLLNRIGFRRFQNKQKQIIKLLEELNTESTTPKNLIILYLIELLKIFITINITYLCISCLGYKIIAYDECLTLNSLVLIVVSSIPSMAGFGPTELAFMLFYKPILAESLSLICLILYRIASYFWPFIISAFAFIFYKNELLGGNNDWNS